jgi:hypothetical protein
MFHFVWSDTLNISSSFWIVQFYVGYLTSCPSVSSQNSVSFIPVGLLVYCPFKFKTFFGILSFLTFTTCLHYFSLLIIYLFLNYLIALSPYFLFLLYFRKMFHDNSHIQICPYLINLHCVLKLYYTNKVFAGQTYEHYAQSFHQNAFILSGYLT